MSRMLILTGDFPLTSDPIQFDQQHFLHDLGASSFSANNPKELFLNSQLLLDELAESSGVGVLRVSFSSWEQEADEMEDLVFSPLSTKAIPLVSDIERAVEILQEAERPVILVGKGA